MSDLKLQGDGCVRFGQCGCARDPIARHRDQNRIPLETFYDFSILLRKHFRDSLIDASRMSDCLPLNESCRTSRY